MATDKAALASGADLGDGIRRRPVAPQATIPGTPAPVEDRKKLAKPQVESNAILGGW